MKTNKTNKIFILIVSSIIVFTGATFEAQAFSWKDYVPDNVSIWGAKFINMVDQYRDKLVNGLSRYKDKFLSIILNRDNEEVRAQKTIIMGSSNYAQLLDRMKYFKEDKNRREICGFMQNFVENYLKLFEQEKNLVKDEYIFFNNRLKALITGGVSWYEITCLQNESYHNNPGAFVKAWAFFKQLRKFNNMWKNDTSLNAVINSIESEFQ